MTTAHIDVNGISGIAATIAVPEFGIWLADVDFDTDKGISGRVTLTVGTVKFSGTIDPAFSGTFGLARKVRIVGGAGGWSKAIPAKHFHNDGGVRLSTVINDAAVAAGETVNVVNDTRLGVDYVRPFGPASRSLATLSWWIDYAGVTQVATRASSDAAGYDLLNFDPRQNVAELAVDDPSQVAVGSLLRGRLSVMQIARAIEFRIDARTSRAFVWCKS